MESQIWSKTQEKWAFILVLRGHEVHCLKVTGISLTIKRKVQGVLEALQQGKAPAEVGAKSVQTLDARTIGKAEVSPGNGSLTLHGEADGSKPLKFSSADDNADEILRAILAQSGRTYQPAQEEIGVVEAVLPLAIFGALAGLFWAGVYQAAGKMAAGEVVEVTGYRRRGMQQMLIKVAEILGTGGTIAVGVVLLVLIVGWAVQRIIHRPERTVWLPEKA
ncbi:hypothetical protein SAMN05444166_0852 [Singulisphaera sp. GP187]|uniref:hypothetical protein n=1 Tax=Singulisphaera sp. GP187 TaxID=1882752 RepID=UPI00092A61F0|nr:hypothetical protein [Singulisphaera sp. GP187]SIN78747.1 hypothetical protein SAMN05444166_0852 [Singulisphaera sp. GP187]